MPVYRKAQETGGFNAVIVAAGAAAGILALHSVSHINGSLITTDSRDSQSAADLAIWAESLLDREQPDLILTGLSGPEAGMDEALLVVATVPTFAIQDFWGDVNATLGRPAGTYFVGDEFARRMTIERGAARAIVTGQPEYELSVPVNPEACARKIRRHLTLDATEPLVAFMGQPLWDFSGYAETVEMFIAACTEIATIRRIVYRPHPKETEDAFGTVTHFAERHGIRLDLDRGDSPTELTAAADILTTAFSMSGQDKIMTNLMADVPRGAVIFMMHPELRQVFQGLTGLEQHPLVDMRLAAFADSGPSCRQQLEALLQTEPCLELRRKAEATLAQPKNASEKILNHMHNHLVSNPALEFSS